jgi:hypothetical protein
MGQAHGKIHLISATGRGGLEISDKFWQHVHLPDKLADIAGSAVLDR